MKCLCGHTKNQHDPEDRVCDAHATEGLGRCPCPGFVPNDAAQLRVAWNRADLYDTAARARRAARDERDLYRKECERLRDQIQADEARRLQLLDDAGGIENERDALRREVTLLQKENRSLHTLLVTIRKQNVEVDASIVAWLRGPDSLRVGLAGIADAIERGAYRRTRDA